MTSEARALLVGVGECRLSSCPDDVIVTYALGSCIAVGLWDASAGIGGMLHFMLPDSSMYPGRSQDNPFLFCDTGLTLLWDAMMRRGARPPNMKVYAAGAARLLDDAGIFDIGRRNYLAFQKCIWRLGAVTRAESVGGTESRSAKLDLATGRFLVRRGRDSERELT